MLIVLMRASSIAKQCAPHNDGTDAADTDNSAVGCMHSHADAELMLRAGTTAKKAVCIKRPLLMQPTQMSLQ